MATEKPYRIKPEHAAVISVVENEAELDADKYHEVPGGVIVPQTRVEGDTPYGKSLQNIPIVEVVETEGMGVSSTPVGVFQKSEETPPDKVAPPGLVAPVSQPEASPLPKRKLIKVELNSTIFGKVTLPVVEAARGDDCLVLVTDASDGFSFVPPVSETAFTVTINGKDEGHAEFCGQTFERKTTQEQYLIMVPVTV